MRSGGALRADPVVSCAAARTLSLSSLGFTVNLLASCLSCFAAWPSIRRVPRRRTGTSRERHRLVSLQLTNRLHPAVPIRGSSRHSIQHTFHVGVGSVPNRTRQKSFIGNNHSRNVSIERWSRARDCLPASSSGLSISISTRWTEMEAGHAATENRSFPRPSRRSALRGLESAAARVHRVHRYRRRYTPHQIRRLKIRSHELITRSAVRSTPYESPTESQRAT